jgi:Membrane protein putatively involved in post-translational modification of the autoinducing quorum-sensing peptide
LQEISNVLAKKITTACNQDSQNTEKDIIIMQYGLELIIENIIKTVALLIVAFFAHKLLETIIVIGVFSTLRYGAGGIHMKTGIGCSLTMLFIWGMGVFGSERFSLPQVVIILLLVVSVVMFYLFTPCDTQNNPITDIKIRKKKRIQSVVTALILAFIVVWTRESRLQMLILIPMLCEVITIVPIVNYINQKRFKEE